MLGFDTVATKSHHHQPVNATTLVLGWKLVTALGIADKKASTVAEAMIRRLRGFKTRSLTYDNGLEFAKHLEVGRELGAKSYFCAPYHAWEKGLVENHNGLLRQYYPKGGSFEGINEDSLRWVEEEINERPRKLLEYACPMLYLNRLTAA